MKGNEVIVECLRKNINRHLRCKNAVWAMNSEELSCFQKLLDKIESDDLIIRNKHYFSDYFVKDDFDDIDFAKQRKESRIYRKGILENVIAIKGWDGIWELARCVGNIEGLIEAIVELTGDRIRNDIYERYCAKELEVKFVRQYFRTLFYEYGESTYLQYISELKAISEEQISIVLYAPEITHEITTLVDTLPGYIQREYWSNVGLWGLTVDHSLYAIERLRNVGRYADILRLVHDKDIKLQIHSSVWLDILFEIFDNAQIDVLYKEYYYIAEVLKCIAIPTEISVKLKLMLLELVLFDNLRHYMKMSDFHLLQIVNTEPEMMMELIQLAYLEDEGYREEIVLTELEQKNKIALAQLAWNFFYNYHSVPGMKSDGTIDGIYLKNYLEKLQQCSEICHRTHVMPLVIGRILGNMPETNDYPSDLMCELVEFFNSDDIDNEICCCLSNRRGMSSRSPFDGGDIERSHVETFKIYRDRALTRSPRLTKIFESEIKSYEHMATVEDERGKLTDFKY